MDVFDDEILQSFLEESKEHLADIENDLLAIEEAAPDVDEDLINKVFRAAHSIKGGAGFMALDKIKDLSHKIENVLGMIRSGELAPNPEITNILLSSFDKLSDMVDNAKESNDVDISGYVEPLVNITAANLPEESQDKAGKTVDIACPNSQIVLTVDELDIVRAKEENKNVYLAEYDLIHDVNKKGKLPVEFFKQLTDKAEVLDCKIDTEAVGTFDSEASLDSLAFFALISSEAGPDKISEILEIGNENISMVSDDYSLKLIDMSDYDIITPPAIIEADTAGKTNSAVNSNNEKIDTPKRAEPKQEKKPAAAVSRKAPSSKSAKSVDTNLRVNVKLLDSLMNLAGELVLGRNELLQANVSGSKDLMNIATQKINHVTSELQEAIMLTRMQPVGNIFNKFPRVVRDLANTLGKNIELTISGKDVELDKTIIEGLADPLTHLVRNAADHGIEDPEVREKIGKVSTGQINLRAYHEAGLVNIEISDDGKGIDAEKLAASAISKGLITEEQASAMSEKEKTALIFMPGFSMAEKLTDVSGRGVGMDVVKTNLDKLGGVVEIDTIIGRGATIRIKLPLTLAIIPSLMISSCQRRYAVPMVNVMELLRIPTNQIKNRVENVGDAKVVRLRQELLPILSLRELLSDDSIETPDDTSVEQNLDEAMNIVVVYAGGFKYGLIVDELHDSEDIVVKPLDQSLKKCKGYAGATIMGNGHVALILDVASLAKMADLNIEDILDKIAGEDDTSGSGHSETLSLLTFGNGSGDNFAVPVDLVERIERIQASDLEISGGKKIIKYRDDILPIHTVDEVADVNAFTEQEDLLVIVFEIQDKKVGLLATAPVDTVDISADFDKVTLKQPGIKGSTIIDGENVLIVDIFEVLHAVRSEWSEAIESEKASQDKKSAILYAEDSNFFRSSVISVLEGSGYRVIEAEDGQIAFDLLNKHADEITMVLTDIEMPNLDGLGLTRKIRQEKRFDKLPIVALTTLADDKDIENGKAAGVTEYQTKLNDKKLLECVGNFMNNS